MNYFNAIYNIRIIKTKIFNIHNNIDLPHINHIDIIDLYSKYKPIPSHLAVSQR